MMHNSSNDAELHKGVPFADLNIKFLNLTLSPPKICQNKNLTPASLKGSSLKDLWRTQPDPVWSPEKGLAIENKLEVVC